MITPVSFPESIVKIELDLAQILSFDKMCKNMTEKGRSSTTVNIGLRMQRGSYE